MNETKEGLTTAVPSDFYEYLKSSEKNIPIEDKFRIYYLRKANGENFFEKWKSYWDLDIGRLKDTLPQDIFEWAQANPELTDHFDRAYINDEAIRTLRMLYDKIINLMKQYMIMSEDNFKIVALWIIGTYFHEEFNTFPFLFINAMRGSGKTRLLKLISALQRNGDGSVNNHLSEAVTFRTAKVRGIIIDELEQIGMKDKAILRELLNSAYKKGAMVRRMKKVKRNNEEIQVVEEFDIYTPIAMANIWGIDEVLGDRCLTIILDKSYDGAVTKKIEDFNRNPAFKNIQNELVRTSSVVSECSVSKKDYVERWNNYIEYKYNTTTPHTHTTLNTLHTQHTQTTHTTDEEELGEKMLFNKIDEMNVYGRNLELFLPLIMIARFLDEITLEDILKIIKEMVKGRKVEENAESKDISLVEFVATHPQYRFNYVSVREFTTKFREYLGDTEDEDRWLNQKWVGRALKRLNLVTAKRRLSQGIEVMLATERAKETSLMFKTDSGDKEE